MKKHTPQSILIQAASSDPQWVSAESIRPRVSVRSVAVRMIATDDATGCTRSRLEYQLLGLLVMSRELLPAPPLEEYQWWEFCTTRLACGLDRGEFKFSEFWQGFVETADAMQQECS